MIRPGLTLKNPTSVGEEAVLGEDARTRALLYSLGIKYEVVSDYDLRRLGWMTYLGELHRIKQISLSNPKYTGHLYRILEVGSDNALPAASFLRSAKWSEFLGRMKAINVEILVDSSLGLTGAAAYFRRVRPGFIGVSLNNTTSDLAHEMSHAEFYEHRIAQFIEVIRGRVKKGADVSGWLTNLFFSGFGRERLQQVVGLVRSGYPTMAINEWFSLQAEVAEMGLSDTKNIAIRVALANRYAMSHLLATLGDLATKRNLGFEERATFVAALAYYGLNHQFLNLPMELKDHFEIYAGRLKDADSPEVGGRDTLEKKIRTWKVWYGIERASAERRKLERFGETTLGQYHYSELSP